MSFAYPVDGLIYLEYVQLYTVLSAGFTVNYIFKTYFNRQAA